VFRARWGARSSGADELAVRSNQALMRFEQFHYGWVSDITLPATVEPHIVTVKRDTAEAPQDRTKAEARLNRACLARVTKEVFRTSLPDRVAMQPEQRATAALLQSAAAGLQAIGRFWCCLITREGSSATGSGDTSHDVASDLHPRSRLLALSDARVWTSLDTRHHASWHLNQTPPLLPAFV
jgi:hypothetical protein